jgi:hypothetical protein
MGKSTINGVFSRAMLVYQRVILNIDSCSKNPLPTSQPRPRQLLRQLGHVWRMAVLDETLQDAAGVPQRCSKRKPGPLEMAI